MVFSMVLRRRLRISPITPYHDEIRRLRLAGCGTKAISKILQSAGLSRHWSTIHHYLEKWDGSVPTAYQMGIAHLQQKLHIPDELENIVLKKTRGSVIPPNLTTRAKTPSVHIHFIFGPKGGSGKSTFACYLAAWLQQNGEDTELFDWDDGSRSFSRFYPEIIVLPLSRADKVIDLAEDAAEEGRQTTFIVDLPPGHANEILDWFGDLPIDVLERDGIALTGWGCVTSDPSSVASLYHWQQNLRGRIRSFFLVRNHKDGPLNLSPAFSSHFDGSVDLEALVPTMNFLNSRNLPLHRALASSEPLFDATLKQTLKNYLIRLFDQLASCRLKRNSSS